MKVNFLGIRRLIRLLKRLDSKQTKDSATMAATPSAIESPNHEAHQSIQAYLQACTSSRIPNVEAALKSFNTRTVPQEVITKILGYLLISSQELILRLDTSTPQGYRTHLHSLSVLRVCRLFYQLGLPLLYGKNIITTSSPATSYDFDAHLQSVPVKIRQLITNVKLEIDWADELWRKFPLIAQQLGQLPLRQLIIILSYNTKQSQPRGLALADKDTNQRIVLSHKNAKESKKDHVMAEAKMKAEKKMLRGLIGDFRTLKVFKLEGFHDQAFAELLQGLVG